MPTPTSSQLHLLDEHDQRIPVRVYRQ